MLVGSVVLWLLVCVLWRYNGYMRGRADALRIQAAALRAGFPRCELRHGTQASRGYAQAHTDLLATDATMPLPRLRDAFWFRRREPHLPDIAPASRVIDPTLS